MTLAQAVERYRSEPGASSNAYEWYRKQAHRDGRIPLGDVDVAAVKVGNQWTVAVTDVDDAIAAHRNRMVEQHRATADYEAHILHGHSGSRVSTDWGGYTISGDFHFAWNSYLVGTYQSDGAWYCNICFKPAKSEHEREECHTCSDWGGCGRDCTLSRIFCRDCGTSKDM
jgi:hypothetical protein